MDSVGRELTQYRDLGPGGKGQQMSGLGSSSNRWLEDAVWFSPARLPTKG